MTEDGTVIEPIQRIRSKSGRHGYDVYEIPTGTRIIIEWVEHSNNPMDPTSK